MSKIKKIYQNRFDFYILTCWLVITLVVVLLPRIILLSGIYKTLSVEKDAAIGIIGGADGPTAVYIASRFAALSNILKMSILMGIFVVWMITLVRFKRNRNQISNDRPMKNIVIYIILIIGIILSAVNSEMILMILFLLFLMSYFLISKNKSFYL